MKRIVVFVVGLLLAATLLGEQTAVLVFGNGLQNDQKKAWDSADLLEKAYANHLGVTVDELRQTIGKDLAYNTTQCSGSGTCLLDWYEALRQALPQNTLAAIAEVWRFLFGLPGILTPGAEEVLRQTAENLAVSFPQEAITDGDLDEQVGLYEESVRGGKKVVIIGHSQGNFFANAAHGRLTEQEQQAVGIVSVATPASFVAGGGLYETSFTDFIWLAPGALDPNTFSGPLCTPGWGCHAFAKYVEGAVSGPAIMADIDDTLARLTLPSRNPSSIDLTRATNDRLIIPDAAQRGLDLAGDFTLEAWVNPSSPLSIPGEERVIIAKWSVRSTEDKAYLFLWHNDGLEPVLFLSLGRKSLGDLDDGMVPRALPVNAWTHVAVVFHNTELGTAEFFVNGETVGAVSGFESGIWNSRTPFEIGWRSPVVGSAWDGLLDEIRVWNIARAPFEIRRDYARELSGLEPGLVGYWKFNGTLLDSSSMGNHLEGNEGVTFSPSAPF